MSLFWRLLYNTHFLVGREGGGGVCKLRTITFVCATSTYKVIPTVVGVGESFASEVMKVLAGGCGMSRRKAAVAVLNRSPTSL